MSESKTICRYCERPPGGIHLKDCKLGIRFSRERTEPKLESKPGPLEPKVGKSRLSPHSLRTRLTVLIALCTLLLSGGTVEPKPYVWPRLFAQSDAQKSSQQLVYYMEAREAELWQAIVQKVADDLLIRDNLELAERITKAIEDSSREFGVDPWLVVALIRVESAGNPNAISYKGARGLTQVMPPTGIQIARELGIKWEGPEMLYDVETSVQFGTYYLGKLLKRFEGNIHAAVAAYFWGPENIARRLMEGSPLPVGYPGKVFKHIKVAQIWAAS